MTVRHQITATENKRKTDASVRSSQPKKVVDISSLLLMITGIVTTVLSYNLIQNSGSDPLILIPAVVAATTGALNLVTTKAPR